MKTIPLPSVPQQARATVDQQIAAAVHQPIFVVGAPRSGKKMTSEILDQHADVYSFPYEMTFLWRREQRDFPYDSLTPERLTPRIASHIRNVFANAAHKHGARRVADRTDHNVVRLDYVREVFPDCRIIHVIRDGRASVASAMIRRKSAVPWKYYLQKAATIPLSDFCYQSSRYAWDVFQARLGKNRYRKRWGIRTEETETYDSHPSLATKCAVQWRECIKAGLSARQSFTSENYKIIQYEDSVKRPVEVFREVFQFAGLNWTEDIEQWLRNNVRQDSVDRWRQNLSPQQLEEVEEVCGELLAELKYA